MTASPGPLLLKPLLIENDTAPPTAILAASPPPGIPLAQWAAGLPPLTDPDKDAPPAPGWRALILPIPDWPATVSTRISPPPAEPRPGWDWTAILDVGDTWLARITITGTLTLWAGPMPLAGITDPAQAARTVQAAAHHGQLAGALITAAFLP